MAVTKIMVIKSEGHLKRAAAYAMNDEKTTTMEYLVSYAADEEKVPGEQFVTGVNCFPETAAEKMAATKHKASRAGGRLGYHIVQSFKPGEVSPELAHKISVEYVKKWLGDFEVVIGTHVNRQHIHSHIVFNSVSCVNGKKFHMNKQDIYAKLRRFSDELCEKYSLSVIEHGRVRGETVQNYTNTYARQSVKKQIVSDIEVSLKNAASLGDFYVWLENLGYIVDTNGKYPKIKPTGGKKYWRLNTLGYSDFEIQRRIQRIEKPSYPKQLYPTQRLPRKKLTRFEALYLHYMYLLGKVRKNRFVKLPAIEYQKFSRYKENMRFVSKNNIQTHGDIAALRDKINQQIETIEQERDDIRQSRREHQSLFRAHTTNVRLQMVTRELNADEQKILAKSNQKIRQYGYEHNPSAIENLRIELEDGLAQCRMNIVEKRHFLKQLDRLEADISFMRSYIKPIEQAIEKSSHPVPEPPIRRQQTDIGWER
ncbi:MAG: relaxase/mobilization nuclease domain-containing protein [Christensenellaceae bacterium]|jgi:hypothetical protein